MKAFTKRAHPPPLPPPPHFLGIGPFFFVKVQIIMIALGGARKFVQKNSPGLKTVIKYPILGTSKIYISLTAEA